MPLTPDTVARHLSLKDFLRVCDSVDSRCGANTKFNVLRITREGDGAFAVKILAKQSVFWLFYTKDKSFSAKEERQLPIPYGGVA